MTTTTPDAFDILIERRDQGYTPGSFEDGHKLGASMDGGGAKTAIVLGMGQVLEGEGLLGVTDEVAGISAGTMTAAYLLAEQSSELAGVFTNHITRAPNRLFEPSNLFGLKPPVNMDTPRRILSEVAPLNVTRLRKGPTPLLIGVSALNSAYGGLAFSSHEVPEEKVVDLIVHGMHVPLLAGRPRASSGPTQRDVSGVEPDGDGAALVDAAVSWPYTEHLAIADDCTDVLSLASRPEKAFRPSRIANMAVHFWLLKQGASTASHDKMVEAQAKFIDLPAGLSTVPASQLVGMRYAISHRIRERQDNQPESASREVYVTKVHPNKEDLPNRLGLLSRNREAIKQGITAGKKAMWAALQAKRPTNS